MIDFSYYHKIQNVYGTNNRREKELAKLNRQAHKHFEDTVDTVNVLKNGEPVELMIVRDTGTNTYRKKNQIPKRRPPQARGYDHLESHAVDDHSDRPRRSDLKHRDHAALHRFAVLAEFQGCDCQTLVLQ